MDDFYASRRSFLAGLAAAGAACAAGALPVRAAQTGRKQVMVAGRPVKVVDIHGHCVIPQAGEVLKGSSIKGDFPRNQIIGAARLQRMDARGIDVQVLSINRYWWYAADRALAAKIVQAQDEGIAEIVHTHKGRFVGATSVALQHPDLAAEQLEHAVKVLGFKGACIAGNVGRETPSSAKYDPFWKKAEELQVPVFMHPDNGSFMLRDGILDGRGDLGNIIGNPLETTLFLSRLIFDGVFDRFPDLKVCGAHAGGYLPSYFGRTDVTCKVRRNADCANMKPPRDYLRTNIMADSMVFTDEGLRHLVAEMGVGQVVYGSDMPFVWPDTIDVITNASWLSNEDKEAILGGTLVKMMKI